MKTLHSPPPPALARDHVAQSLLGGEGLEPRQVALEQLVDRPALRFALRFDETALVERGRFGA